MKTGTVLFGIGGYGDVYVQALTDKNCPADICIAGVVDPFARSAPGYEKLLKMDVAFFDTPEAFYSESNADLAVIATPIPLHEPQAVCAMEHGSHVLLEKPIAATPESGKRIAMAAERTGRKLAVGFQWCYDKAMLKLKSDADSGILGMPRRMRALVLWPRDLAYYSRGTGWAGKKLDKNGNPIFDSVVSNATAHYLENMLWLAGNNYNGASFKDMRVETWCANEIETFDTVTLTGVLENGVEITYAASHAVHPDAQQDPMFEYEFENATVYFGGYGRSGSQVTAKFRDGTVKEYGAIDPNAGHSIKLWHMIDAIRTNRPIPCPASAALRHTEAIAMIHRLQPEAFVFEDIRRDDARVWVPGLDKQLIQCYEQRTTLSNIMRENMQ